MAQTRFETHFREFVKDFGGLIVPENEDRSADYFFPQHNVVAELKCLVVDQSADFLRRRDQIIRRARKLSNTGRTDPHSIVVNVATTDGERVSICFGEGVQRELGSVLLSPIENIIRDANRQIRATKERLSIPSARGVVLIFNEGSPLHAASPQHFAQLVGEVIQKPVSGERRFPHIQGLVYFSFSEIQTFDAQSQKFMPFWLPAQVQGDSVSDIKEFQEDLKQRFYQYIERHTGAPVVAHHRETGWPVPPED